MRLFIGIVAATVIAACGEGTGQQSRGDSSAAANAAPGSVAPTLGVSDTQSAAQPWSPALNGRSAELLNPDASSMVFLYYDLAGIAPPVERWVEEDRRVAYARAHDKASLRAAIRAELESAAASVRDIGFIRLSMHANLSDYDPTYGEFTVRALAPSSVVSFDALGQTVSVKFANGRTAQLWQVPDVQAQMIRDKIGRYGDVSLDALLKITSVLPGPAGGTIITEVLEYEMRQTQRGFTIGRVQVAR